MYKLDSTQIDLFADFELKGVQQPQTIIDVVDTTPNVKYDAQGLALAKLVNNRARIRAFVRGRLLSSSVDDPDFKVPLKKHRATFDDGDVHTTFTQNFDKNIVAVKIFTRAEDQKKPELALTQNYEFKSEAPQEVVFREPLAPDIPDVPLMKELKAPDVKEPFVPEVKRPRAPYVPIPEIPDAPRTITAKLDDVRSSKPDKPTSVREETPNFAEPKSIPVYRATIPDVPRFAEPADVLSVAPADVRQETSPSLPDPAGVDVLPPDEPDALSLPDPENPEIPEIPPDEVTLPPSDETETAILFITTAGMYAVKTFQLQKFLDGDLQNIVIDFCDIQETFNITDYYTPNSPDSVGNTYNTANANFMDSQVRVMQTRTNKSIDSIICAPFEFAKEQGAYKIRRKQNYQVTYTSLLMALSFETAHSVKSTNSSDRAAQNLPVFNFVNEYEGDENSKITIYTPGARIILGFTGNESDYQISKLEIGDNPYKPPDEEFHKLDGTPDNAWHALWVEDEAKQNRVVDVSYLSVPGFMYMGGAPYWTGAGNSQKYFGALSGWLYAITNTPAICSELSESKLQEIFDGSYKTGEAINNDVQNAYAWAVAYVEPVDKNAYIEGGETPDSIRLDYPESIEDPTITPDFYDPEQINIEAKMPYAIVSFEDGGFDKEGNPRGGVSKFSTRTFKMSTKFSYTTIVYPTQKGYYGTYVNKKYVDSTKMSANCDFGFPPRSGDLKQVDLDYPDTLIGTTQPAHLFVLSFPPNDTTTTKGIPIPAHQYITYTDLRIYESRYADEFYEGAISDIQCMGSFGGDDELRDLEVIEIEYDRFNPDWYLPEPPFAEAGEITYDDLVDCNTYGCQHPKCSHPWWFGIPYDRIVSCTECHGTDANGPCPAGLSPYTELAGSPDSPSPCCFDPPWGCAWWDNGCYNPKPTEPGPAPINNNWQPSKEIYPKQLIDGWFHVSGRAHYFQGYIIKEGKVLRKPPQRIETYEDSLKTTFIDYEVKERFIFMNGDKKTNWLPKFAKTLGFDPEEFVCMLMDVPDYVITGLGFKKIFVADIAESIEYENQPYSKTQL